MEEKLNQSPNIVEKEKSAEEVSQAVFFKHPLYNEYRLQLKENMPPEFYEKMEKRLEQLLGEDNYSVQDRGNPHRDRRRSFWDIGRI